MKTTIAAVIVACTLATGCANLKFQWSASYATDNLKADLERAKSPEQK